jgi:hypothetical protein
MYQAKTKVMVVAVVADALTAAVTVKAVVVQQAVMQVVQTAAVMVKAVVAQATARRLVNAQAMTAVTKASQVSAQVANPIKANAQARLAVVTAPAHHVAIALQPVAVVQVAAKVAQQIALTAVVKVVQQAVIAVETRNNVIMNG